MDEKQFKAQLAFIHQRLQTMPHANHEAQALNDLLRMLIQTLYGEVLDLSHQVVGGGHILADGANVPVYTQGQRQGREIAPGVIEYNPHTQRAGGMTHQTIPGVPQPQHTPIGQAGALIDVAAQLGQASGNGLGAPAPAAAAAAAAAAAPGGVQPVPGSLMYAALHGRDVGPGAENVAPPMNEASASPIPAVHPGPAADVEGEAGHPAQGKQPYVKPAVVTSDPIGDAAAAEMAQLLEREGNPSGVQPGDAAVEVKE